MDDKLIIPRKLQGFWELMPKEEMCFESLLEKIEETFRNNCFVPLDTPVLEYSEALLAKSGGDTDKEVYRFTKGSTDMCMRYDLTVPLARFVSMHKDELSFPFKRYQIGKVYRGEKPQKGRFREFYQCDADIIGNEELSLVADAECVSLFEKCFKALNLDVEIRVSNRKILAGYIEEIGKNDKTIDLMIVLDKLDKLPKAEIESQLSELGLTKKEQKNLVKLIETTGNIDFVIKNLEKMAQNNTFVTGLEELKELDRYLKDMGVSSVVYDLSIIRGHNYYTGTVFEGFLSGRKNLGAIGGGGRFDNLCSYFSNKKMPGVGMSVGITRLFSLLMQENYFNLEQTNEIDCAVITFDETFDEGLKIVQKLRKNHIHAEIFYENKTFKSKMKEANRRNVGYVVIVGEDEVKANKYTLKNMQTSNQESLSLDEIAERIRG
ncbi:MAG: histidine--tRNA ligase [Clostridia bacterium]|nr:histidine--tRNA ligase [Clostridia bacterium]